MKDLTVHGVPYRLMTDGWWLDDEPAIHARRDRRRSKVRALLLGLAAALAICVIPAIASPPVRDLPFAAAGLPR